MEMLQEVEFWVGVAMEMLSQLPERQVTVVLVLLAMAGLAKLLVKRKGSLLYRVVFGVLAIGVLMAVFGLLVIGYCLR
jgi:hypothetical protein